MLSPMMNSSSEFNTSTSRRTAALAAGSGDDVLLSEATYLSPRDQNCFSLLTRWYSKRPFCQAQSRINGNLSCRGVFFDPDEGHKHEE